MSQNGPLVWQFSSHNPLIGAVFIDFKKAFDLVNHEILLYKLKLYHFDDLSVSFFHLTYEIEAKSSRQKTQVSQSKDILSGVPQGSIIGPLLFLIYVNYLSMHLTCNTEMYADETTLHESSKSLLNIQANLQTNLLQVQTWCKPNNMIMNNMHGDLLHGHLLYA